MFYKKRAQQNSTKFTGKKLCQSRFFNKVAKYQTHQGHCFLKGLCKRNILDSKEYIYDGTFLRKWLSA